MTEDVFLISLIFMELGFIAIIGLMFIALIMISTSILNFLLENLQKMKRVLCYLIAIKDYLKYGIWTVHTYQEVERYQADIFAGDTYFREADNLEHRPNEQYHKNVTIIRSRCKYCGQETTEWTDGSEIQL